MGREGVSADVQKLERVGGPKMIFLFRGPDSLSWALAPACLENFGLIESVILKES